ncbi:hypothetical protein PoB_001623000 [Plakobranchus ocellatus]|uniref:Uncharacterized protein n=1 Tax=Plakobranchus ocellatus TaxID=259542 RepID=A0AAV3Z569_9GAST|nr:hypothetical protein PoB_001623000 [Plakobranchus ocellatus]
MEVKHLEYKDSPHPMTTGRVSGLHFESFDKDRNPKMTSIMNLTNRARVSISHTPLPASGKNANGHQEAQMFLDGPRLTNEFYVFASCSEFVMSRALYETTVPKGLLDIKFVLGHVGNCTVSLVTEFYACVEIGSPHRSFRAAPLWTNTHQFVTVDKNTRKPAQLHDWFQDKYKGKGAMERGLTVKPFDRPAVTYAHPTVVQWTDTDHYNHTSWSSYVRWATDALHAALLLQNKSYSPHKPNAAMSKSSQSDTVNVALCGISKEIVVRGLRKMQVIYLRECLEGEHLETHVWQEEGAEKELVWFSVVKDGEDRCQIKMWFFRDKAESVSEEEEEEFPV